MFDFSVPLPASAIANSSTPAKPLAAQTAAETLAWARSQLQALPRLQEWLRLRHHCSKFDELGVRPALEAVLSGTMTISQTGDAFEKRFLQTWIDAACRERRDLRQFEAGAHLDSIRRFGELDHQSIKGASARISRTLLSDPARPRRNDIAPKGSEVRILMHQAGLKKRHWPLRKLFALIPTVLPRLKPCVMVSPLAVSTFFGESTLTFDVVVFDEASQIRPFDSIGAIYRGSQLVVAGDPRQLPPTSFFDKLVSDGDDADSDEDEDDPLGHLEDFESILDVCTARGLSRRRLRWHYRSRRESLIAFSNRHIYDSELVTFPSVFDVASTSPIDFQFCEDGRWKSGKGDGIQPDGGHASRPARRRALPEVPHQVTGSHYIQPAAADGDPRPARSGRPVGRLAG